MSNGQEGDSSRYYISRDAVKKDPVYTIIPIVRTPNINPGDTFEVDLYFSGAGYPNENKLAVYHSHPNLVNSENPGTFTTTIKWKDGEIITGEDVLSDPSLTTQRDLDEYGFLAKVSNAHFIPDTEINLNDPDSNWPYPPKSSELGNDGIAPMEYRLNTAEDAAPGDYEISFVFTYGEEAVGDELRINQDRQNVSVHIKNKREQLEPIPSIAAIAAALIALLSLIYTTGVFSLTWDIYQNLPFEI